jgi:hypothetical protein
MIALGLLIIVSNDALSRVAVEEPILVVMTATLHRGRNAPDHHLQDRAVVEIHPVALKQLGLHVGNYANRLAFVNQTKSAREMRPLPPAMTRDVVAQVKGNA